MPSNRTQADSKAQIAPEPTAEEFDTPLLPEQVEIPERYRLLKALGHGAKSIVYEAFDTMLRRKVAIKIMDRLSMDAAALVRFQNEAKVTCRFDHPNIVRVLDFGVSQSGRPFMVLEHVTGVTLKQYIQDNGPLDNEAAFKVFESVASALSHASRHGVFHRDLKPENLIIQTSPSLSVVPKLIDFGLAKFMQSDEALVTDGGITLVGTPTYMSPDQVSGLPYDVRSEIYSFGCVLFEALTGSPVFTGPTALRILALHRDQAPPLVTEVAPEVAPELAAIVARCLQKSPVYRFENFEQIVDELGGTVEVLGPDENATPARVTTRSIVPLLVVAVLACIGLGVYSIANNQDTKADTSKLPATSDKTIIQTMEDADRATVSYSSKDKKLSIEGEFKRPDYEALLKYPDAHKMKVGYKQHFDLDGFELLKKLPFTAMHLRQSNVDDRYVDILADMKTITNLNLQSTKIGDASLKKLATLPNLDTLNIDHCNISDNGLKFLAQSRSLKNLSMNDLPHVTADGLNALNKMNLAYLSVSSFDLNDDCVRVLSQSQVKQLCIFECNLDDRLVRLYKSRTIVGLNVEGNPKLGREGLAALLKLPTLQDLNINQSASITPELIGELKSKLKSRCDVHISRAKHNRESIEDEE